ncbi:uracil-DNA glycosylase [bacterium]|nr:uracil-DNA glycosylase [bacterium]
MDNIEKNDLFNDKLYQSWDELEENIIDCKKCELCEKRNKIVIGAGSKNSKLMLIGEGPGADENESGIPFVGKAGKLLTKILESVGIDREKDIYITNIVKCQPPGNRNPKDNEMAICLPYLLSQIKLLKPKAFILCGGVSAKFLLGKKEGITKLRGRILTLFEIPAIPIFHPSYLLRNPSRKEGSPKWQMWEDMKLIKSILDDF